MLHVIRAFQSVAEQTKLPLTHIARMAELGTMTQDITHLDSIQTTASSALELLDSYLLSLQLSANWLAPELETVSLPAVLQDVAHTLQQCNPGRTIELDIPLRSMPVIAHPLGLATALQNLGQAMLDMNSEPQDAKPERTLLAIHSSRAGLVAGAFANMQRLQTLALRRAKTLHGQARTPFAQLTSTPSANVFVADVLLGTMSSSLRLARHQQLPGLAATFLPSKQLSLV